MCITCYWIYCDNWRDPILKTLHITFWISDKWKVRISVTVMLSAFILKQAIMGTGMILEVTGRGGGEGRRIGIGGFEHQWSHPLLPPPENISERDKLDKVGQLWDSCLGQIWYRWGNSCPPFLFILGNSVFADFFIEIKWTLLYIYFFENIDFEICRLGGAKKDHRNTISRKIHKNNSIRLKIGMYILDVFLS